MIQAIGSSRWVQLPFAFIVALSVCAWPYATYRKEQEKDLPSWSMESEWHAEDYEGFTIQEDSFQVLILSDLHLNGIPLLGDETTLGYLEEAITTTNPDLIVFGGDVVYSWFNAIAMRSLAELLEQYAIPWTLTFGNHDGEFGLSRSGLVALLEDYPHCLLQTGPQNITGYSNQWIPIWNESNELIHTLSLLDTNEYQYQGLRREYAPIAADQVAWYQWHLEHWDAPNYLIIHKPLHEFEPQTPMDNQGESVSHGPINSGLFDLLVDEASTRVVLAGHDHKNWFQAIRETITLQYIGSLAAVSYSYQSEKHYQLLSLFSDGTYTLENRRIESFRPS